MASDEPRDRKSHTELRRIFREGNVEEIKELIDDGFEKDTILMYPIPLNYVGEPQRYRKELPLEVLFGWQNWEALEYYLTLYSDKELFEVKNIVRMSVVEPKILKIVLDKGCNPNEVSEGQTPLIYAMTDTELPPLGNIFNGVFVADPQSVITSTNFNLEVYRLLLSAGASMTIRDNRGRSATDYSTFNIHYTNLFIEFGADFEIKDRDGCSALSAVKDEEVRKAIIDSIPLTKGANMEENNV